MGVRKAYLEETQEVVGLFDVARDYAGLTQLGGKGDTLPQRPVLNGSREERGGADFLPQIKTM